MNYYESSNQNKLDIFKLLKAHSNYCRKSVLVRPKLTSFIIRCTNWLWQDFFKQQNLNSGCLKSWWLKVQCGSYLKSIGTVHNKHIDMNLERSWQLVGQCIQEPLHGSDLTGPLCHTWHFWPLPLLWSSPPWPSLMPWAGSPHFLLPFLHFSLTLFPSPTLWLGEFPKVWSLGPCCSSPCTFSLGSFLQFSHLH